MAKKNGNSTSIERLEAAVADGEIVTQSEESKANEALRIASEAKIAEAFTAAAKQLAKLDSAKDSDFSELTSDLWKPTKKGDTLTGIYLGIQEGQRLKQYAFGVRHDGEDLTVRVNGGAGLRRLMPRVPVGSVVKLTFLEKKQMEGGKTFNDFAVAIAR